MHATTEWSRGLDIEVRGDDVVSRTGNVITRMLADKTGLTTEMSDVLIRPDVTHDRGAVMRDLAVAIADGASCMSEIAVLGDQSRCAKEALETPGAEGMWSGVHIPEAGRGRTFALRQLRSLAAHGGYSVPADPGSAQRPIPDSQHRHDVEGKAAP
jgi:hypothetical protein